jgi:hypothetical protein
LVWGLVATQEFYALLNTLLKTLRGIEMTVKSNSKSNNLASLGILVLFTLFMISVPLTYGLEIIQVGEYDFGTAYDIVYRDEVAYVSGNDGVYVFDVSDRGDPVLLTQITESKGTFGLAIDGDILYVAGIDNGLFIVNVSDPDDPVILGSSTEIMALDVYVDEGYAYVASGGSFSIVDVSEPRNPVISSTVHGEERISITRVFYDTLYLGETNKGLMVYDVSDRGEPVYLNTVSGTGGIFDIEVDGETMFLSCHGNGVKVLDLTDRRHPRVIGSSNNGGEAYGVHVVNDFLMVADLQQGIEILDISDPGAPTLLATWTETHPHGISGDSHYVYLADQDDGFEIFVYGDDLSAVQVTGNITTTDDIQATEDPTPESPDSRNENDVPGYTYPTIIIGLSLFIIIQYLARLNRGTL